MSDLPQAKVYCGPFAISVVTGLSYEEVCVAVRRYQRLPADAEVTLMNASELVGSMALLGWQCIMYDPPRMQPLKTLHHFVRNMNPRFDARCILSLHEHFCVITADEYIDNQTLAGVPLWDVPRPRSRVHHIYEVSKL